MPVNQLAGKALLLTVLSTMCRKSEALQMRLSGMQIFTDKLIFTLPRPTKIYNAANYRTRKSLQQLEIPHLTQDPLLCPMRALLDYLENVKPVRKDIDFVFILFQDKSRPASSQTISHWAKLILKDCGLPEFGIASTRSASALNALLMGIPLDEIVGATGWTSAETFLKSYMKPSAPKSNKQDQNRTQSLSQCLALNIGKNNTQSLSDFLKLNNLSSQKLVKKTVGGKQSVFSKTKLNRKNYDHLHNRQLESKDLSPCNKTKLNMSLGKIDLSRPSVTGKLDKIRSRDCNARVPSGSHFPTDKRKKSLQTFSSQVFGNHRDKLQSQRTQLPHKNVKSVKPPITCHETINRDQKYSQGFVSTKRSLSNISSELSTPKKSRVSENTSSPEKSLPSLSPLKSFKTVWTKSHHRISNPSNCKTDQSVCKKYISHQSDRTGKNYSKLCGQLTGRTEAKHSTALGFPHKHHKGKGSFSKLKICASDSSCVTLTIGKQIEKQDNNSRKSKIITMMHSSLFRETLSTDQYQSDLWKTSLSEVLEARQPTPIGNGTCPKTISINAELLSLLGVPPTPATMDNNRVPPMFVPELPALNSHKLVEQTPHQKAVSPGQMSYTGQYFLPSVTQTVFAEGQKGAPAQETPALHVDRLSPPVPPMETEDLDHWDLLEDQHQRNLDMTKNDTENSNVSLTDNYEPFDLQDVDFSSLVPDFDSDVLDECEGDKSEIDNLLLSLSPLKSPQKETAVNLAKETSPRKGKVQVPGGNIKAISISQLPEDFKNRMKEVMTCKTSTGGTTCLIHLGSNIPICKDTKLTDISSSDNTPSTTKIKLREMLKNRKLGGGPPPISSTFIPLVTTGLSHSKYARRIAQMNRDNEKVLQDMSSTGGNMSQ